MVLPRLPDKTVRTKNFESIHGLAEEGEGLLSGGRESIDLEEDEKMGARKTWMESGNANGNGEGKEKGMLSGTGTVTGRTMAKATRRHAKTSSFSGGSGSARTNFGESSSLTGDLDHVGPTKGSNGKIVSNREELFDDKKDAHEMDDLTYGDDKGKGKGKAKARHVSEFGREESVGGGHGMTRRDKKAFALLVALYCLQGIPIGLTFGTLPFLLKTHLSYSQLAMFQFATWPYSLKLLWSPVVDAWFSTKIGRRKSWIIPVQLILGLGMWLVGSRIEDWMNAEIIDVKFFTAIFLLFILFAATQDIAVDGWALTLLTKPNLSYASTAQTIGLNIGHALSFTLFLALNSIEFSNRWLRTRPSTEPIVTLGGYMHMWAVVYWVFTIWLAVAKKEDPVSEDDPDMDVKKVYRVMWSIVQLKDIQSFLTVHLVAKIGFQIGEITSLKLIEKGLPKEDLAIVSLLNVPLELLGGWIAAHWSRGSRPLKAWERAFWARFVMAGVATCLVWKFPTLKMEDGSTREVGTGLLAVVVVVALFSSFASTIQFVGISAFHTQIADPVIGGTYMTLLNTVSNLGGTWPKPLVLRGIDFFSEASCHIFEGGGDVDPTAGKEAAAMMTPRAEITVRAAECISDHGKSLCSSLGGRCITERDGYYAMSFLCVLTGLVMLVFYIKPTVRRLQTLPLSAWRVKIPE